METLGSIAEALQPGDYLTSVDLQKTYLHVPIVEGHRHFLRFCVQGRHWQIRALPFGLSTAPRVFSKILIHPIVLLRDQGVHGPPVLE